MSYYVVYVKQKKNAKISHVQYVMMYNVVCNTHNHSKSDKRSPNSGGWGSRVVHDVHEEVSPSFMKPGETVLRER